MTHSILILGESGVGKSTAIRTLNPEETFIINVIDKPLPFKGAMKKYNKLSSDGLEGNYYATDDIQTLLRIIRLIDNKRLDITNLIIDDFGYTITNNFMRKAMQKGYDKFSELGANTFDILEAITKVRDDLFCFVMMHTEIDHHGRYKPRTCGKMIDQYICIEGKFTYVYHALIRDDGYKFLTNNDNHHIAKTPLDLHDEIYIDNDLQFIKEVIINYENED